MFSKRHKEFLEALRIVVRTEQGKKLFKYLAEDYVKISAIQDTVEKTYYRLGQKELVQELLDEANLSEEDLRCIQIMTGTTTTRER